MWAGEATAGNGTGAAFAVVRFNAIGALDQGFGASGLATTTFANSNVQGAQTVLVQPNGKILAGAAVLFGGRPPNDIGGLVRFNADGSIDKGFGSGGQELVPNSNPVLSSVIGGTHTESSQFSSTSVFGLARVNADGTLDPASGTGGVLTTRIQGKDFVSLLIIQPDGKILTVGTSQNAAGVTELAASETAPGPGLGGNRARRRVLQPPPLMVMDRNARWVRAGREPPCAIQSSREMRMAAMASAAIMRGLGSTSVRSGILVAARPAMAFS